MNKLLNTPWLGTVRAGCKTNVAKGLKCGAQGVENDAKHDAAGTYCKIAKFARATLCAPRFPPAGTRRTLTRPSGAVSSAVATVRLPEAPATLAPAPKTAGKSGAVAADPFP